MTTKLVLWQPFVFNETTMRYCDNTIDCLQSIRNRHSIACPLWCLLWVHHLCVILRWRHYGDAIMGAIASQITSLTVVYSTVYSDADQRKHQSSASLAFVRGIHRGPVNSPHKWPVTRKMFPFDDVIRSCNCHTRCILGYNFLWYLK